MLDYAVIYQSETGNTKAVAEQIFRTIPGKNKEIFELRGDEPIPEALFYFVGFGIRKGICSMDVINLLGQIRTGKAALFATCGSRPTSEYKKTIESEVSLWLEDESRYMGMFLCQGKVPGSVRKKLEEQITDENEAHITALLHNFDEAYHHPDAKDMEHASEFARVIIESLT